MVLHGTSLNEIKYSCATYIEECGHQCGMSAYFTCGCKDFVLASCKSQCSELTWGLNACFQCEEQLNSPRYPYSETYPDANCIE